MKVYEIQKSFSGIDAIRPAERPKPRPGPREALIRMQAVSLNFRDLMIAKGIYNPNIPLPRIPLSDGVGEVVEVGPEVTRVKRGDRVAGIFMQGWIDGEPTIEKTGTALGGEIDGVLAEYVTLHEDGLVHVPEHLTDEQAATLPCAAVTAWNALAVSGSVKPGDTVLTLGTGGVSLFALQFARLMGARVIITSSSDAKLLRAEGMGAAVGINYKKTPEWHQQVLERTHGRGVDHVIELGGAGTLPQSLQAVRMGGHISLIGVLTGAGAFNPIPLLMKHARVQGIFVGSRAMFESMNKAIALHKMLPVVDRVFAFDQVHDALRYMESGEHFGKIVIRIG
ncbi:MAG TPA: NAD(P)-dependent alcohol dehydrogenase [Phycisphaerae bacterium]|jgi:NADPH:quinone reductase-like Zn-dependent oxidoreductase|nr:NAD(P)-dependent alcohol dehydrogenase [Phycisphaerae bacterium]HOB72904.1 NAD(P)-dependent alcohol dehydrogenase [Phycisphaerae bacterium]HOJ53047.1 NAD(P)-dependent alcohol dehydrogenase [Phycisphaerae bacterium]HOL24784.1 NAD(P)-dependent alcohol dehydrogenase [Phycisphaerae bacterium]HPP19320.1 NAD(P)-dependent alcohol dehydrogenase [Phycisphaerae bacterium]